jgi:flotillin
MSSMVIAIAGAAFLLLLVFLLVVRRIKVAGPNEAFLITGRKGKPVKTRRRARSRPTCRGRRS